MRATKDTFDVAAFSEYIEMNDGQILTPTNEWEVLRYKISRNTFVIYQNKRGELNIPADTMRHFKAMEAGRQVTKGKRPALRDGLHIKQQLLERDGDACACCGQFMGEDRTLEHWLGVASGGSNSSANLALMHEACNKALGNLPVIEKFRLCQIARDAVEAVPPWETVDASEIMWAAQ